MYPIWSGPTIYQRSYRAYEIPSMFWQTDGQKKRWTDGETDRWAYSGKPIHVFNFIELWYKCKIFIFKKSIWKCPFIQALIVKPWLPSESMHTSWVIFLVLICQSFIQSYDDLFLMNHLVSGEHQSLDYREEVARPRQKTHMMVYLLESPFCINTLRPRQNGRHFTKNMFKCIFMNKDVSISSNLHLTNLWAALLWISIHSTVP